VSEEERAVLARGALLLHTLWERGDLSEHATATV